MVETNLLSRKFRRLNIIKYYKISVFFLYLFLVILPFIAAIVLSILVGVGEVDSLVLLIWLYPVMGVVVAIFLTPLLGITFGYYLDTVNIADKYLSDPTPNKIQTNHTVTTSSTNKSTVFDKKTCPVINLEVGDFVITKVKKWVGMEEIRIGTKLRISAKKGDRIFCTCKVDGLNYTLEFKYTDLENGMAFSDEI